MPLGVQASKRRREGGTTGSGGTDDSFLVQGQAGHRSFRALFNSEELSDCVVEASDCRSYDCHRIVLAAASPVLRAVFRSFITEGTSSKVQIHGASPQTVELLLRLIYGKSVMVPVHSALELYMLADQYQLSRIANKIAEATAGALTSDALCSLLPKAHSTLSSTATFVRKLVKRAAEFIPVLPDRQPFHSWELALVQQVIQADKRDCAYAQFLAAAKWVQGAPENRKQHWPGVLLPMINFESFTTADIKVIEHQQTELLQLEGVREALLKTCCNRLPDDYCGYSPGYDPYDPGYHQYAPRSPHYDPDYLQYAPRSPHYDPDNHQYAPRSPRYQYADSPRYWGRYRSPPVSVSDDYSHSDSEDSADDSSDEDIDNLVNQDGVDGDGNNSDGSD